MRQQRPPTFGNLGSRRRTLALLLLIGLAPLCSHAQEAIFANGFEACSGPGEPACPEVYVIDFCRLQFPLDVQGTEGDVVEVYGRLYIAGLTDMTSGNDEAPEVTGWVGHGPDGSDPALDATWTWTLGVPNPGYDASIGGEPNNDEYVALMTLPAAAGSPYDFAYRFTGDGGGSYTYCDGGAAGSTDGYQIGDAGSLQVF